MTILKDFIEMEHVNDTSEVTCAGLARKKEEARESDRLRVERGEITRDQLQAENSIIPMELANDPEWKATRLAAAASSLSRPRARLAIPPRLLQPKA